MKSFAAFVALCIATAVHASPFPNGNPQTGHALFDKYRCNSCHAAMLGGDGSAMFTRADRKVHNADELLAQIRMCGGNVGANLGAQDEQHLGAYLNQYYKLK